MASGGVAHPSPQAMGGSAEQLHFPENDVEYDVDSSDEDLDGMEAAVARFEDRRSRRAELETAARRSAEAATQLDRERAELARAVAGLREQRRRFETARAAGGAASTSPARGAKADVAADVAAVRPDGGPRGSLRGMSI